HYGQLGIGSNENQDTPVQVGTANTWKWIETTVAFNNSAYDSYNLSIALKDNNSLWLWGRDYIFGIEAAQPLQTGTDTDWKTVSIRNDDGNRYALLVKQNGTLWAWGKDQYEQLGNGPTTGDYNTITQIGTENNWKGATAGYRQSSAVKSDGTFWVWGATSLVGNGTGDIPSPMQYDCTPLMSVTDQQLSKFEVYPNPAKDIVNFSKAIDGELFDPTDKKVLI